MVDGSERATAARSLALIVNALSPDAHERVTPRAALWREAVAGRALKPETPGLKRAAQDYDACRDRSLGDSDAGLRWCLQLRHDALIIELNSDYWAAVKTGS